MAIGDGANDVNMLLEAKVGIGIQGREGSQATRVADFSIPKFHYISDLIFRHGFEAYRKISLGIYHIVYKNLLLIYGFIFYGFFSNFSGVCFIESFIF